MSTKRPFAKGSTGLYIDLKFVATYGIPLACRSARFIRDEHAAWGIWGNWLLSHREVEGFDDLLVKAMRAGIFFDYDPMTKVLLPQGWRPCADHMSRYLHMRLWIGSHAIHLRDAIMKEFLEDSLADKLSTEFRDLIPYMTQSQRDALLNDIALMMHKLDYEEGDDSISGNAAFDIFLKVKRVPRKALYNIWELGSSGSADMQTYRAEAFDCLILADRDDLETLFRRPGMNESVVRCFKRMEGDDDLHGTAIGITRLFRVLDRGDCALSKRYIMRIGHRVATCAQTCDEGGELDQVFSDFEELCDRCLGVGSVDYYAAMDI